MVGIHGRKIAVIGLGYVGLPVAVAFAAAGDFDALGRRTRSRRCRRRGRCCSGPCSLLWLRLRLRWGL